MKHLCTHMCKTKQTILQILYYVRTQKKTRKNTDNCAKKVYLQVYVLKKEYTYTYKLLLTFRKFTQKQKQNPVQLPTTVKRKL